MTFDMSHEIKLSKILKEELKCHRCKSLPTLEALERHRCTGYDNHAICQNCFKKNRNCPCGRTVNPHVCSITRKLFTARKLPISCKFNSNGCQILHFDKQKLVDHEKNCSFSPISVPLKNRVFNLFKTEPESEPNVQYQCQNCFEIFDGDLKECKKCKRIKDDMANAQRNIGTIKVENEGLLDTLQEHKKEHRKLQFEIGNEKTANFALEHLVQMKNQENSELKAENIKLKQEIERLKSANHVLPIQMPVLLPSTPQKVHIVEPDLNFKTENYENRNSNFSAINRVKTLVSLCKQHQLLMSMVLDMRKIFIEDLTCYRCQTPPTLNNFERYRCNNLEFHHCICKNCFHNRKCPCGKSISPRVCDVTNKLFWVIGFFSSLCSYFFMTEVTEHSEILET